MKKKILVLILVLGIFILPLFAVGVKTNAWTNSESNPVALNTVYDKLVFTCIPDYISNSSTGVILKVTAYVNSDFTGNSLNVYFTGRHDDNNSSLAQIRIDRTSGGSPLLTESFDTFVIVDNITYNSVDYSYFVITEFSNLTSCPYIEVSLPSEVNPIPTGILVALTEPISTLGVAILGALVSYFDVLVIDGSGISNITTFMFVILSISLVIGMTRWIVSLIRRKI